MKVGGFVMQERRKHVRRQADRELLRLREQIQSNLDDDGSQQRRQRRRIIRHNCKAALDIQVGQSSGGGDNMRIRSHTIPGRVLDLSKTGASLFTHHSLEVGDDFRLLLLVENGPRIEALAAVRWIKRVEDKNGYASGVEFTKVGSRDQELLDEFLARLDSTVGL